jgi:hypothetical protein
MIMKFDVISTSIFLTEVVYISKAQCRYCPKVFAFSSTKGKDHLQRCPGYRDEEEATASSSSSVPNYLFHMSPAQLEAAQRQAAKALFVTGQRKNS